MCRKILFSILILGGFSILMFAGTILKAGERPITDQFRAIPFNPKLALSFDPLRGDANGNGEINGGDIVYLTVYLFRNGSPPPTLENGDANGDGEINIADIIFLKSYLFLGGPPPPYK